MDENLDFRLDYDKNRFDRHYESCSRLCPTVTGLFKLGKVDLELGKTIPKILTALLA